MVPVFYCFLLSTKMQKFIAVLDLQVCWLSGLDINKGCPLRFSRASVSSWGLCYGGFPTLGAGAVGNQIFNHSRFCQSGGITQIINFVLGNLSQNTPHDFAGTGFR